MTKIFAYKISDKLTETKFRELMSFLSDTEKDRVNNFKKRPDAEVILLSRYLLRQNISFYTGIDPREINFTVNSSGRPVLKYPQVPNLFFNMSHSGDWIVGALSFDKQIGIDIEKIRPIDITIAEDYFSAQELKYMNSRKDSCLDNFFKIWTLKESYIKAIGKGLYYPLKNFYFEFGPKNEINIKPKKEVGDWNFKFYNIDPCYKFAVCQDRDKFSDKVEFLDL